MKKIMFNDRYGLTQAVLEGKKTMTRRIIPLCENDLNFLKISERGEWLFSSRTCLDGAYPAYNVGEELAVAQSYKELIDDGYLIPVEYGESAGYCNKMFVKADRMPHCIRITDVKAERLQNISDDDCMKEGIYYDNPFPELSDRDVYAFSVISKKNRQTTWWSPTPRIAFENLIIHMMGKKVWKSNPYVWAYTFELVK
jgi:hypothetical protein